MTNTNEEVLAKDIEQLADELLLASQTIEGEGPGKLLLHRYDYVDDGIYVDNPSHVLFTYSAACSLTQAWVVSNQQNEIPQALLNHTPTETYQQTIGMMVDEWLASAHQPLYTWCLADTTENPEPNIKCTVADCSARNFQVKGYVIHLRDTHGLCSTQIVSKLQTLAQKVRTHEFTFINRKGME